MNGIVVLKEASKVVLSVLGTAKSLENVTYVKSLFVVSVDVEDGSLLYSFLTGELILVRKKYSIDYLINHRFLVDSMVDELSSVAKYQRVMRLLNNRVQSNIRTFEIMTTTSCNANCFYCYEKEFPIKVMSDRTSREVAKFIMRNKCSGQIHIRWYGGEPLMNTMSIDAISDILANNNINWTSSMITNGLLFSGDLIRKVQEWRLKHVTITLDGTEKTYNSTKSYNIRNISPYKIILRNITGLLEAGMAVTIRVNIEQYNLEDAKVLLNDLRNRFCKYRQRLGFMLRPLMNTAFDRTIESIDKAIVFKSIMAEMDHTFALGYKVTGMLPSGVNGRCCKADSGNYIVIKPDGDISFCTGNYHTCHGQNVFKNQELLFPDLSKHIFRKVQLCGSCPKNIVCIPTKDCATYKETICKPIQKELMLHEIRLSMLQKYREFLTPEFNEN